MRSYSPTRMSQHVRLFPLTACGDASTHLRHWAGGPYRDLPASTPRMLLAECLPTSTSPHGRTLDMTKMFPALALFAALVATTPASAILCGGTISSNTTLSGDLDCSRWLGGQAIRIINGATLDGAGRRFDRTQGRSLHRRSLGTLHRRFRMQQQLVHHRHLLQQYLHPLRPRRRLQRRLPSATRNATLPPATCSA